MTTTAPAPAKAPAKRPAAKAAAPSKRPAIAAQPVNEALSAWTPEELAEVRAELEAESRVLRKEIADASQLIDAQLTAGADGTGDDQADAGTATFEREHEMSLANNSRDMLIQTERALQRIDDGTYGACENCGRPIGKERLQAFPRATLDKQCKQREERR